MGNFRKVFIISLYIVSAVILTSGFYLVLINFDFTSFNINEVKATTCANDSNNLPVTPINGYCYYLGNLNESCTTTCANITGGPACDATGLSHAYSLLSICGTIGQSLNGVGTTGGSYGANVGCSYNTSLGKWRLSSSAPACANTAASNRPACACAGVNPVPNITQIITGDSSSSSMKAIGGSNFTLIVNGTDFVSNSTVNINGSARATTYIGATQLFGTILASDIAAAGTSSITVFNPTPGGGTSTPVILTVYHKTPTLTSISPTSTASDGVQFTLTLTGTNFDASSTVYWNSSSTATTYISSTQIIAVIPAANIATTSTSTVKVFNPTPVGGTSSPQTFIVFAPIPVPTTPGSFTAIAASTTIINLVWADVAGETSYRIERALETFAGSGIPGVYSTIATLGVDVSSYQNTGLSADTLYYYKIFAVNGGGDSVVTTASVATLPVTLDAANTSDFKVQRSCSLAKVASTTVTLFEGTDYTAPNSTSSVFIRLVNTRGSGTGVVTGGGSGQDPSEMTWYISDPDFTDGRVIFKRSSATIGSTYDTRFCWEIIEYIGAAGGPNDMKVRSVGAVTYGASDDFAFASRGGVVDSTKVVVYITGQNSVATALTGISGGQSTASLENCSATFLPVDQVYFCRGSTQGDANSLSYAAVEFTGSNWAVKRVGHQFIDKGVVEKEKGNNIALAQYYGISGSVSAQDTIPQTIALSSDGNKMYMLGAATNKVYQYALSPAWNVSSATYESGKFVSVVAQDYTPTSLVLSSDGTKMYMGGSMNHKIFGYSLSSSTPWDISSATYDGNSILISAQDSTPMSLVLSNDGYTMYMLGGDTNKVYQYSLSLPFDISTAYYAAKSIDVTGQDINATAITVNSDGTTMYMTGWDTSKVYQYTLSTPFDISSATYDGLSVSINGFPSSLALNNNESYMYSFGYMNKTAYQYSLSTAWVFPISRTFFHTQFRRSGVDAMLNAGPEIWLSGTNEISFLLDSAASAVSNKLAVVWVVSNKDDSYTKMNVQHVSSTRLTADVSQGASNNEDEWTKSITAVESRQGTSIMGENGISTGGGITAPYGWLSLYLASTTGVKIYQTDDARDQYYHFDVVEWPHPKLNSDLSSYRFFNNSNNSNITSSLALQNTPATLTTSGAAFRLRSLINYSSANHSISLPISAQNYFLQFGKKSGSCDSSATGYGNIGSSTAIAFKDNSSVEDGGLLTASSGDPTSGAQIIPQSYKESNPFSNNISSILSGKAGLWDFSLYDNGAPAGITYCIRAINDSPWNIKNNFIYENKFLDVSSSFAELYDPRSITFSVDGSYMYVTRHSNVLSQYSLSTPWDVTTAGSYGGYGSFQDDLTSDPDITIQIVSTAFKADGKKMYVLDSGFKSIYEYSLTEPWKANTAIYSGISKNILELVPSINNVDEIAFSNNGTKFYAGTIDSKSLYQFNLTDWDISTINYVHVYHRFITRVNGIAFNGDGTKVYLTGSAKISPTIYASAESSWFRKFLAFIISPLDMFWSHTPIAKAFFGNGGNDNSGISGFSLSIPWDIRSLSLDVGMDAMQFRAFSYTDGVAISPDGNKIYYLTSTNEIKPYTSIMTMLVEQYKPIAEVETELSSYSSIAEITTVGPTYGSLVQKNYRWYKDVNTKDPVNSDSASAENSEMTNLVLGRSRHLRISVNNPSGNFASGQKFKLQYQKSSTTAAWTDVGPGNDFTGFNNDCASCTDGSSITALRLTGSNVLQTYEEPTASAISAPTPRSINSSAVAEWDWSLTTGASATAGSTYYFRMVGFANELLGSYQHYPKLTISSDDYSFGEIKSIVYDTGSSTNAQLNSFTWEGQLADQASVRFQFAVSATSTPVGGWEALFYGPSGSVSWYTSSGPSEQIVLNPTYNNNMRFFRYKLRIETSSGISPIVNRVIVNYSP